MGRALIALGALLALLGAASIASAAVPPVKFAGCLKPEFQPRDVLLACGDGSASFSVARWSRWTRQNAKAVGTAVIDDCDPNCAAGHFHSQLAALILDRARTCHGARRFTRLRLVFAVRPVRGQPTPVVYPCR